MQDPASTRQPELLFGMAMLPRRAGGGTSGQREEVTPSPALALHFLSTLLPDRAEDEGGKAGPRRGWAALPLHQRGEKEERGTVSCGTGGWCWDCWGDGDRSVPRRGERMVCGRRPHTSEPGHRVRSRAPPSPRASRPQGGLHPLQPPPKRKGLTNLPPWKKKAPFLFGSESPRSGAGWPRRRRSPAPRLSPGKQQ